MTTTPISAELLARVVRHACAAFPDECCGYLLGPKGDDCVDALVECRNAQPATAERTAETGFAIAGVELLAFARTFDGERPARIVYHSHTNGRAYFSDLDREVARYALYPVQHLVVGVLATGATEAALFAADGSGEFAEVARWPAAVLR
jgi:proteasome lid subunit RPN8/RPN11